VTRHRLQFQFVLAASLMGRSHAAAILLVQVADQQPRDASVERDPEFHEYRPPARTADVEWAGVESDESWIRC